MTAATQPDPARRPEGASRGGRAVRALVSPSRFAVVGLLGIVVNQVALFAFTELLGLHYLLSAILASQVSTAHNFVLTEAWVFRGRDLRGGWLGRFLVFDAVNALSLLLRLPILYLLTDLGGVNYLVSNLVAIAVTFALRYFVADTWIWAGTERRVQRTVGGRYHYDIHGILRIRSVVAFPEIAAFNVDHEVTPDLDVRRRLLLGGGPRRTAATARGADGVIRYREQLGVLSAAFDVRLPEAAGAPVLLEANWLLAWSHHVLYTNMVEPLLRFLFVDRGYMLLHAAAIDADHGAVIMSALTDTGKTSTVLRLLKVRPWGFLSDDMVIVAPGGTIISYPKPMTLSSHTMSAVNDRALPVADRVMLAIRSRVHSKEGRTAGHALGRRPIPIVTLNCWVQLVVPPPKYHVTTLVECRIVDRSTIDSVILMERGEPLAEEPTLDATVDRLLANTDDAYTFPPFATFSPLIALGGRDLAALRARERGLLAAAIEGAWKARIRVRGHAWAELVPTLIAEKRPMLEGDLGTPPAPTGAAEPAAPAPDPAADAEAALP